MHIFHSRENIKPCIFTAVKIQDLIFSRETVRLELLFSIFSIWSKGTTLYGISGSFLRETIIGVSYFYGNCNKQKSELLRSLIKERAFINSSATTRKSKANVK